MGRVLLVLLVLADQGLIFILTAAPFVFHALRSSLQTPLAHLRTVSGCITACRAKERPVDSPSVGDTPA